MCIRDRKWVVYNIGSAETCDVKLSEGRALLENTGIGYNPEWGWYVISYEGASTLIHLSDVEIRSDGDKNGWRCSCELTEGMLIEVGEGERVVCLEVEMKAYNGNIDKLVNLVEDVFCGEYDVQSLKVDRHPESLACFCLQQCRNICNQVCLLISIHQFDFLDIRTLFLK
eukprot:TRINITY_DN17366_c0_g1_i1.p1 TRINITY_DN17366_c0_g1~~TRINITY_DN17366_c0_g1_i1.p1  ORF type:complete len:190 (-),score=17.08 TRINITY_DN17366_c0_g1_i1:98-607(-)